VLLSLFISYTNIPGSEIIVMIATGALAGFYYITGIGLSKNSFRWRLKNAMPGEKQIIWMRLLAGLCFTMSTIAILFNELYFRTYLIQIYVAVALLTLVMFFTLLLLEKNEPILYRFIMMRSILFSGALLFYLLTPLSLRLEWKYDDQYYREILQYAIENPNDKDAQKTVRDYERRQKGEVYIEDEVVE
jgi:hypothetical protein